MKSLLLLFVLLLFGCAQSAPQESGPQKAEPLNPLRVAGRMAVVQAASVTGNQDEANRQIDGLQDEIRRAMKLADPARRIEPEAARAVVKAMPGVHSVVWLSRDNLLAMVEGDAMRSQKTIDAICMGLEPLGDTLGVIVNLKIRAARGADERRMLSRNCQLVPGEVAMFQTRHPDYDPPPEVVAAFRASQRPQSDEDRKAQLEAQRILEASTPEM